MPGISVAGRGAAVTSPLARARMAKLRIMIAIADEVEGSDGVLNQQDLPII
jgi:hypothetical protein